MSEKLKPIQMTVSPDGFLNMLNNQNGGAVVDELNRELHKGVGAILDHGGKAEITLKIKLSKSIGIERGVTIEHDVIAKHPKEIRPAKTMFVSSGNGLLDAPEKQGKLELGDEGEPVKTGLEATGNVTRLNH